MRRDEFADLLQRFAQRPMPALRGRHIYLWHGELVALQPLVPAGLSTSLDLHQLAAGLPRAPRARGEAGRLLRRAIQSHLNDNAASEGQQVVIVTGCDLLSRYRVPLTPFFEIASESLMVVFVVPPTETYFVPVAPLPSYVSMNSIALFDYLHSQIVGTGAIVAGEE